jgi:hypothetical protein
VVDIGQQLFGQGAEFDVRFFRAPLQQLEGAVRIDAIDQHQRALRLFDRVPVIGDFGDCFVDDRLAPHLSV